MVADLIPAWNFSASRTAANSSLNGSDNCWGRVTRRGKWFWMSAARRRKPPPGQAPVSGRRRVLVVEDDPGSLEAVCELLVMMGHLPTKADDAYVAREALLAGRFDILLTDVELSGMSGLDLAHEALVLQPDIRIIFCSGHPMHQKVESGFVCTAPQKLYSVEQLAGAIRAATTRR
jgi:CheY-like chemotaxis protein